MNRRWKRLLLVRCCNQWFRSDVVEVRTILGIPVEGFERLDEGEEYAILLNYRRNGILIPLDSKTNRPLLTLPPTREAYDLRAPSPLLRRWGIGKLSKGGGSPIFPNENLDVLSTDPLNQHAAGLIIRYGLPDSEDIRNSIRKFILTSDENYIDFNPPVIRGITKMSVKGLIDDEEFVVTLEGVSPDINRKDWNALYSQLKELLGQNKSYREHHQFDFHRFMYHRVKILRQSIVEAEREWADVKNDLPAILPSALSQAFHDLEELMKPLDIESDSTG